MRRASDIDPGRRNGRGRRARDRLLSGEPPAAAAGSSQLEHLLYFACDDLQAAAMAVGGIERFLIAARGVLEGDPSAESIAALVDGADPEHRLEDLESALGSLVHALRRLRGALADTGPGRPYDSDIPTL